MKFPFKSAGLLKQISEVGRCEFEGLDAPLGGLEVCGVGGLLDPKRRIQWPGNGRKAPWVIGVKVHPT